jgi:ADP-heptose:LPS heptosyltransferase/GT2 family glycosyltransferase
MGKEAAAISETTGTTSPGSTLDELPFVMTVDAPREGARLVQGTRVTGSGWILAHSPIESVTICADGVPLCEAATGVPRPDVGATFPQYPNSEQSGFKFTLEVDQLPLDRTHLTIRVRTADSLTYERELGLQVVPQEPQPAAASDPQGVLAHQLPTSPQGGGQTLDYFKLEIDSPRLVGEVAPEPVRGILTIQGWALARGSVQAVRIAVDELELDQAHYGIRREDVAAAFPDWPASAASGFGASIPPKALTRGSHTIRVEVSDREGRTRQIRFSINVEQEAQEIGPGVLRSRMSGAESALAQSVLAGLSWHPRFELILAAAPGDNLLEHRRLTLASLVEQEFENWRLSVILRPEEQANEVASGLFAGFAQASPRVSLIAPDPNRALAALWPEHLEDPVFAGVLWPGDRLGCDALLETAVALGLDRSAEFIYTDERRTDPSTGKVRAFFKPDWSPDLLLSTNYIGRLWFACAPLLARAGSKPQQLDDDYTIVLTLTQAAQGIKHLPMVLCERGSLPQHIGETTALQEALRLRGIEGEVLPGCISGTYRLKRPVERGKWVSIIIPTCGARGLVRTCIKSLREHTRYRDFEVVCVENVPPGDAATREWLRENSDALVTCDEPFNWSKFNNLGAAAARADSEYLLFLNDDIEIIEPEWLEAMLEHGQRDEVGVVGPLLLYPDRRIQHASLFMLEPGKARHAFRFAREDEPGPFGLTLTQRDALAVTGACMLVRRSVFESLGRFDEAHTIINNDLDFCLRCRDRDLRVIFSPYSKLIHHELASRSSLPERYDVTRFETRWKPSYAAGDPYYSPWLTRHGEDFSADPEPLRIVAGGHPLLRAERVRSILALKLDHIGDFITALAALRRIKSCFPAARLCLLAGSATARLAYLEPCIDEVIEFNFFNTRSSLGPLALSDADLLELKGRLAPYRFDIAIDLRKHMDARHVLQYTSSKLTAGYDSGGRFPWLDIAIEWDGDRALVAKRQHVADDLLRLVDAVATSCVPDRYMIGSAVSAGWGQNSLLGMPWQMLLSRPVVCVHPVSGNVMRQWPLSHFADLIELLLRDFDVHVALIGTADERAAIEQIAWQVRRPQAVFCLAGALPLQSLPQFLSRCALFVGNNSGPKHIAAGLGVPTIGLHSGIVDAVEWAPLGPLAVAVRRDMSCSPCYLSEPGKCRRNLACLTELKPRDVLPVCHRLLGARGILPSSRNDRVVAAS